MKKFLALLFAVVMMLTLVACKNDDNDDDDKNDGTNQPEEVAVVSYEEYMAAELQTKLAVEVYVQATQSWWDNKITVYAADEDGAYFIYEMACSEEDAAKLTEGAKIKVTGYKAEWGGEIEIIDATFEFIEAAPFVAEAKDLTQYLGTDGLIDYQNQLAIFKGLTVEEVEYKNGAPGDDIYVTVTDGENSYSFCVERYLTAPDTLVYKTAMTLAAGDVVDVEGFVYWYEGVNTHITDIKFVNQHTMTYAEYDAAAIGCMVTVDAYVQAHQSWWDNKVTVYAQDEDGAYFLYELACSEEDAAKLTAGAAIKVNGYKAEWAGEIEIVDATFEFVEAEPFIAEAKDVTEYLGTEELIDYQNQFVIFTGMTVEEITYKNGAPGDDIYVSVSYNGTTYGFCVEYYLTGTDTDVYAAVQALEAGNVIDVEGFLYWYEGVNTHITGVTVK